jgi:predicted deacetylase
MPATYLVRFDDICPTMNWTAWDRVERILRTADVKPIVAVVPDNRDPHLRVEAARPQFWRRVRAWQRDGWTIGLHGYQHRYETADAGIVGRNRYSEFAGLPEDVQRLKIERALAIFESEGVTPDVWVAPAHSFDTVTLRVLAANGVRRISDGYGLRPWTDRNGMLWVPQQIGRFRALPAFVWTVCLHHNGWGCADIGRFRRDIQTYRSRIAGFRETAASCGARPASLADRGSFGAMRLVRSLRPHAGAAR